MLKSFALSFTLALTWLSLLPPSAQSQQLEQPAISQPPVAEANLPFCYMQTSTGSLMDLTRFCGNATRRQSPSLAAAQQSSATTSAFGIPNSVSVPGSPTCIIFDDQGRPCVPQSPNS